MTNIFQIAVAATVALSFTAMETKPVQAAESIFWDLDFFNSSSTQVGSGAFSYKPDSNTFVQVIPTSGPFGFTVQNPLDSFSANILGVNWGFEAPGITWWADSSRPPGQQRISRYGIFIADKSWFFGDPFFGTRQLLLDDMESVSDNVWTGDWVQVVYQGGGPPFSAGSGAWTATRRNLQPVPEPTLVLALLAVGTCSVGVVLKRQLKKQDLG